MSESKNESPRDHLVEEAHPAIPEEMIAYFLENPGAIDRENEDGETLLVQAAETGDLAALNTLLEMGAEPKYETSRGMTALMMAAMKGHVEIVNRLLEAGVDPMYKNAIGTTALMIAAGQGHLAIAQQLVMQGAPVEDVDDEGDTPLGLAICTYNPALVQFFLERTGNLAAQREKIEEAFRKAFHGRTPKGAVRNAAFPPEIEPQDRWKVGISEIFYLLLQRGIEPACLQQFDSSTGRFAFIEELERKEDLEYAVESYYARLHGFLAEARSRYVGDADIAVRMEAAVGEAQASEASESKKLGLDVAQMVRRLVFRTPAEFAKEFAVAKKEEDDDSANDGGTPDETKASVNDNANSAVSLGGDGGASSDNSGAVVSNDGVGAIPPVVQIPGVTFLSHSPRAAAVGDASSAVAGEALPAADAASSDVVVVAAPVDDGSAAAP